MANSSTTIGTKTYNFQRPTGHYLILQNNVLKGDGNSTEFYKSEAQFYEDTAALINFSDPNLSRLFYRIRPVSQPNKYFAVSGSTITLKDVPSTNDDSSYDFEVEEENLDYAKYLYRYSPDNSPEYMSVDSNNDVILAADSQNAWFDQQEVATNNVSTVTLVSSEPDYLDEFEDEVTTIISTEELPGNTVTIVETEESFSEKIVFSDRVSVASVSEE